MGEETEGGEDGGVAGRSDSGRSRLLLMVGTKFLLRSPPGLTNNLWSDRCF